MILIIHCCRCWELGTACVDLEIVNEYLASIGISRTRIHHSLQPAAEEFGDGSSNVSCPSDIGILFEKLYRYELFSSQQSEEILNVIKLS